MQKPAIWPSLSTGAEPPKSAIAGVWATPSSSIWGPPPQPVKKQEAKKPVAAPVAPPPAAPPVLLAPQMPALGTETKVVLMKPDKTSKLGIVLVGADETSPPTIKELKENGLAATVAGVLRPGQLLMSVNGKPALGHASATNLLKNAVGEVRLVILVMGSDN